MLEEDLAIQAELFLWFPFGKNSLSMVVANSISLYANPLLLPLQVAAVALPRAHSPEAMKLRANGMPSHASVCWLHLKVVHSGMKAVGVAICLYPSVFAM